MAAGEQWVFVRVQEAVTSECLCRILEPCAAEEDAKHWLSTISPTMVHIMDYLRISRQASGRLLPPLQSLCCIGDIVEALERLDCSRESVFLHYLEILEGGLEHLAIANKQEHR